MPLQDAGFIQYNLANQAAFSAEMRKAISQVDDLSWPLNQIARDFYKSEVAIFSLKSAGGFEELNTVYAQAKMKKFGEMPILVRTGKLARSVTEDGAEGSIKRITRKSLIIGTRVPYGIYHNSDSTPREKIPQRKFLFIGPESRAFEAKDQSNEGGRLSRWSKILSGYVTRVLQARET